MPLLLLFLCLPFLEIWVFILVGDEIGFLAAIGLLGLAGFAGAALLMRQGLSALIRASQQARLHTAPLSSLLDGLLIGLAGIFLIIPGFITDGLALALLLPPLRAALAKKMLKGSPFEARGGGARTAQDGDIIDGDFEVLPPGALEDRRNPPESP